MMPEDRDYDLNRDGRLDAFEFGYKLDEEEREMRDGRRYPSGRRLPILPVVLGLIVLLLFAEFILNLIARIF